MTIGWLTVLMLGALHQFIPVITAHGEAAGSSALISLIAIILGLGLGGGPPCGVEYTIIYLQNIFCDRHARSRKPMRLTLQTDYALRVLMYVGMKTDALSTIPEIVDRFDISKGHVMKVVNRLGQLGYLETIRGKHGGIKLGRKPGQINVGAVVRDMEEELGVLGCLQGRKGYCRIENCCVLRSALREATRAFLSALDRYTLADLIKPRRELSESLSIAGPTVARAGAA